MIGRAPILMVVTDSCVPDLEERLADAIAGGATIVQYRDKHSTTKERIRWISRFRDRHAGPILVVNDDLDAAIEAGAAGVHLSSTFPFDEMMVRRLGSERILGRSLHAGAIPVESRANRFGDYVTLGTVFASDTHPGGPVAGLAGLSEAIEDIRKRIGPVPVLAIGGITSANAADCIRSGAQGVAVIRGILMATDPGMAAAAILASMGEAI